MAMTLDDLHWQPVMRQYENPYGGVDPPPSRWRSQPLLIPIKGELMLCRVMRHDERVRRGHDNIYTIQRHVSTWDMPQPTAINRQWCYTSTTWAFCDLRLLNPGVAWRDAFDLALVLSLAEPAPEDAVPGDPYDE